MAFTSASVVNTALQFIASQSTITSLTDGSVSANYANVIYQPVVQLLLRELEPDFSRKTATLALSGVGSVIPPWTYEYIYPSDCVRLLQVRPSPGTYNVLDPQPIRSSVFYDPNAPTPFKVILTNQVNALGVYVSSNVTESNWDASFAEAVSRRLANPLAMALSGRPDFAREILEESARMAEVSEMTDDGMSGVPQ